MTTLSINHTLTCRRRFQMLLLLSLGLLLLLVPTASAYRKGDVVETGIVLQEDSLLSSLGLSEQEVNPTLRSQMPKFGINSRVLFHKEKDEDDNTKTKIKGGGFTLLFEEGLRSMEHVLYSNNKGEYLDKIQVQFVYSKSGAGVIHSVWLKTKEYSPHISSLDPVQVEYLWTEEKPIHLTGGYAVCFFMCFVASIVALVYTCVLEDEETEAEYQQQLMNSRGRGSSNNPRSSAYGGYNAQKHN